MDNKQHSISRFSVYGQLTNDDNIPDFAKTRLRDLYDDCEKILEKTLTTAIDVKGRNFHDYKPAAAKRLISETLLEPRIEMHSALQKHITSAAEGKQRIKTLIKSYSMPKKQEDPSDQIDQSFRLREIRDLLRQEPDLQKRKSTIQDNVKNGDGSWLVAAASAPDKNGLLPGDSLWDLQRQHAFKLNPDLQHYEHQVNESYRIVRQKAAELNASQQSILMSEDFRDPLSKAVHFTTFPPKSPREKLLADDLLLKEMQAEMAEENKQEFSKDHAVGISL